MSPKSGLDIQLDKNLGWRYQKTVASTTIFTVPGQLPEPVKVGSMSIEGGSSPSTLSVISSTASSGTSSTTHGGDAEDLGNIPEATTGVVSVSVGENTVDLAIKICEGFCWEPVPSGILLWSECKSLTCKPHSWLRILAQLQIVLEGTLPQFFVYWMIAHPIRATF